MKVVTPRSNTSKGGVVQERIKSAGS